MPRTVFKCWVLAAASLLFSGVTMADPNDPRDTSSPFGVLEFLHWNHDWNSHHYPTLEKVEEAVRLMSEAGIGMVRMDFLWLDIEPAPGKFDIKRYDAIVDILGRHNIKILGLLNYNSGWSGSDWNSPPDPEHFTRYAREVVKRYRDRIKYWEIWNEPDDATYWDPQDGMKAYTALLRTVYPAIKEEDPTSKVLLGGISKYVPVSLKQVYTHGGKDSFDIVNFHVFRDPMHSDALDQMRGVAASVKKTMEKFGDGEKEIWITEIGAPGVKAGARDYTGWWAGPNPTEEVQAEWLTRVYTEALRWPGVKKIFWAFFRDTDRHFQGGGNDFGLVRKDFSPKPAYHAYKKIISESNP